MAHSRLSLPRLAPQPTCDGETEKHEVVVVGAGPAGLMLGSLLARYGLDDTSLLCIDSNLGRVECGRADGLQPRTLEVFQTLGLADQILREGCHLWEVAVWKSSGQKSIERSFIADTKTLPARYQHVVTLHQGRIEEILETAYLQYSKRGVRRNCRLVNVEIDEAGDKDFPVVAEVDVNGASKRIRTKFLVGADGAHSAVRQSLGLSLDGETQNDVWGVVDFAADTDFPDIRRRCLIKSAAGSLFVIPRERAPCGSYLTRLYVEMPRPDTPDGSVPVSNRIARHRIPLKAILLQVSKVFEPYYICPKGGKPVEWWTTYQVGQRILKQFSFRDSNHTGGIYFVGDACHTHSPKAGQGMNVSMMDAYNLAWKLTYSVKGLTPCSGTMEPDPILETYHDERFTIAQELINFDKGYSSKFRNCKRPMANGGSNDNDLNQFLQAHRQANGFTSGCGVEYPESVLVRRPSGEDLDNPITGTNFYYGILRAGRRMLNVRLKRYADGSYSDLHDELSSNGCFTVICFVSSNFLDPLGSSAQVLNELGTATLPRFPLSVIEQMVIYPSLPRTFSWKCVPPVVKELSEMKFYDGSTVGGAYLTYGVDPTEGALAVIRPDGYVGMVATLKDSQAVMAYLKSCIKMGSEVANTKS